MRGLVALLVASFTLPAGALELDLRAAEPELVRAELGRELGPLEAQPEGVLVIEDEQPNHVRVLYRAADGRTLERVIEVHADPASRAAEIALLAASLVRDAASKLVPRPPPPTAIAPPAARREPRVHVHVDGWINPDNGLGAAALLLGGRHWHAFLGGGGKISLGPTRGLDAVVVLGAGAHVPLTRRVALGFDGLVHLLHRFDDDDHLGLQPQLRATVQGRVTDAVALYAGPTLNLLVTEERELRRTPVFTAQLGSDEPGLELWPGLVVGVRLLPEARSR